MKTALCKCDSSGRVQHNDCFAGSLRSHKETPSDSTASLKTAFIGANTIMERTVQIILHSFRCWEPWAVQHQDRIKVQHITQILPMEKLHHFDHSSYYRIFLQGNNSIHRFYCQTERMLLTGEPLATFSDEEQATQGGKSRVPSGSCPQAPLVQSTG